MARVPVLAAGGIVFRHGATPLVAVVRLRKREEWVLPKGKLARGETAREAAIREVLEETGHAVSVHEFLGTLAYQSGGGPKFVHFWRMQADSDPVGKLMKDVIAVVWLPLEEAIARLSREYERVFLAQVGPMALEAKSQDKTQDKRQQEPEGPPLVEPAAKPQPEPDQLESALLPLSPAETAAVAPLRLGPIQKFKAWLRGQA
ncbi:MAG: NUDIX hydrolase [Bradyrhizobium sp.]|uniref:NUDIX hydrolase n=1 Tax=Bradyrhizobium sp. TaxID=376 RepID=UPI0025C4C69B|nr:NUDIX hydrolase [Bradyrhizobium sp.]MBI5265507.1 NUDIX hydrolase [Bradyrhizobium sp.]